MPAERKIIAIDEAKCNGCGICTDSCHEGAIEMRNGKAVLISDAYCDGLGDCLAPCPTGAISIITRQADAYDEEAVKQRQTEKSRQKPDAACPGSQSSLPCGCPGTMSRTLPPQKNAAGASEAAGACSSESVSELVNWPVQLKLIPPEAPYLQGADLLLAADCVPVAVPDFHSRYLAGRPVAISCPKLDDLEPQIEKLTRILTAARPDSVTVLRMEVPCCGGLVRAAEEAVKRSGINIPLRTEIISTGGRPAAEG